MSKVDPVEQNVDKVDSENNDNDIFVYNVSGSDNESDDRQRSETSWKLHRATGETFEEFELRRERSPEGIVGDEADAAAPPSPSNSADSAPAAKNYDVPRLKPITSADLLVRPRSRKRQRRPRANVNKAPNERPSSTAVNNKNNNGRNKENAKPIVMEMYGTRTVNYNYDPRDDDDDYHRRNPRWISSRLSDDSEDEQAAPLAEVSASAVVVAAASGNRLSSSCFSRKYRRKRASDPPSLDPHGGVDLSSESSDGEDIGRAIKKPKLSFDRREKSSERHCEPPPRGVNADDSSSSSLSSSSAGSSSSSSSPFSEDERSMRVP